MNEEQAQERFTEWLEPNGRTVQIHVFRHSKPKVEIRLLADGRWEFVP